jgi:hypothetical protein
MVRIMKTEQLLGEIMDFIHSELGESGQLRIGIWSEEKVPFTFYAVIYDQGDNLITGEASYGTDSIEEALTELSKDIRHYKLLN